MFLSLLTYGRLEMIINSLCSSHCYAVYFPPLECGLICEYSNQWSMAEVEPCRSEPRLLACPPLSCFLGTPSHHVKGLTCWRGLELVRRWREPRWAQPNHQTNTSNWSIIINTQMMILWCVWVNSWPTKLWCCFKPLSVV